MQGVTHLNSEVLALKTLPFADFNKPKTPTTKSFTTSRKKPANSPIRRRCIETIDALHNLGYTKEIPLEDAIELFQATLGIMDRASVKAYFGVQPHKAVQRIERMARYQSGVMSLKTIELAHKVGYKAGYFELLRLATIQKKESAWFFVLNEVGVVPQIVPESLKNDGVKSKLEISLSPIRVNEQLNGLANDGIETDREERESIGCEREILWTSENPETAKPEPVKCVACGKVDESNPYRIWCPKGGGERSKSDSCIVEAI